MKNPMLSKTFAAILAIITAFALSGCLSASSSTEEPPAAGSNLTASSGLWAAAADDLRPETTAACRDIWARSNSNAPAEHRLIIVVDRTASVADQPLPEEFIEAIRTASSSGGSLSVIGVEGAGTAPKIILKNAALNTPGPLDRPSVKDVAEAMPACVASELLTVGPTAPGSDLHAALAAASELSKPESQMWVLSDGVTNAGLADLNKEELLLLDPEKAALKVTADSPLDLKGAHWKQAGLANTATGMASAHRTWMRTFTRELCARWNATGCQEIDLTPVNPIRTHSGKLPEDPAPSFPRLEASGTSEACNFTLPASLAFAGNSADLLPDMEAVLQKPILLATSSPSTRVRITGHTASVPQIHPEELIKFAQRRAETTADVFRAAGIPEDRLTVAGVGDSQPRVEDIDPSTGHQIETAAAQERRVEILIEGESC